MKKHLGLILMAAAGVLAYLVVRKPDATESPTPALPGPLDLSRLFGPGSTSPPNPDGDFTTPNLAAAAAGRVEGPPAPGTGNTVTSLGETAPAAPGRSGIVGQLRGSSVGPAAPAAATPAAPPARPNRRGNFAGERLGSWVWTEVPRGFGTAFIWVSG